MFTALNTCLCPSALLAAASQPSIKRKRCHPGQRVLLPAVRQDSAARFVVKYLIQVLGMSETAARIYFSIGFATARIRLEGGVSRKKSQGRSLEGEVSRGKSRGRCARVEGQTVSET